ncbi:hypothetical protein [Ruegeria sp. B32]|uniref:hypothetical protein n=1 Tax=Ruegeria sp. B32 TaxID=2867020 RepID=UPI0021A595E4|nr:hypothetical protein [Ruegeria sp. B32]UWR05997.1 hypothetical protein K3752_09995 [Ruegeria sp. B32]
MERNPWDKAVSAFYFWMYRRGIEVVDPHAMFTRFCQEQLQFFSDFDLYSTDGEIVVDRVIRYERLAAEFGELMQEVGIGDVSLNEVQAKAGIRKTRRLDLFYGRNWRSRNVDLVADVFSAEIAALDYNVPYSHGHFING